MSIFSRFRDIISANFNDMLDKAEDPEKMARQIIREIEETLVDTRASCAGTMASRSKVQRALTQAEAKAADWEGKAQLAVDKGREDLAREALLEKRLYRERADALAAEIAQHDEVITQYKDDLQLLEDKLEEARNRLRILVQRHVRAQRSRHAQTKVREVRKLDVLNKFEKFEQRIDRMEAEADLLKMRGKPTVEDEFAKLATDDEVEKELAALKEKSSK